MQRKKLKKIREYYGSGSRSNSEFFFGKSSQNSSKPVLIFWSSILSVYTLIKVVSYYDLSVLSMSVMGFQKKSLDWVSGVRSIQVFLGFLEFF